MALSKIGSAGLASGAVEAADIADGAITSAKLANPNVFMGRNRIINGAMMIDQRNAGASVTFDAAGKYPVDRFPAYASTDGTMTAQQSSVAPVGFTKSVVCTTTTADGSLAAGQYCCLAQIIEGFNVADLGWGTANAKTVTLSFWVRSSLTGTFGGSINNNAYNRSYPFTYTISTADTWEQKSVTIAGDTSGTWTTDNTAGIRIYWGLGVGSTYSGTAGSWVGAQTISATGAVSVIGTLNATWYITGVQLEVGSTATDFERRQYGQELALCQRYYFTEGATSVGSLNSASKFNGTVKFPVTMRTTPSVAQTGTITVYGPTFSDFSASDPSLYNVSPAGSARVVFNTGSGGSPGQATYIYNTGILSFSAEL